MSTTSSILQQLNTIPNPGGIGLPIQQYATTMQSALTHSLEYGTLNQITTLTSSQTALTSLQTSLAQFQDATDILSSSQSWSNTTASSSNTAALAVTASPGALPSSYSVDVGQLATNQINFALSGLQSSASSSSNLIGGSMDIIPAATGVTVAVTVTAGESLNAIALAVNASSTLIQASVINTGSGSTPYELLFQSTQTGSLSAFTLTDATGSTLISMQLDAGNPIQLAQNATATLDGSIAIQSSTNTFASAIPNISFTALQANSSSTLSVNTNTSSVVANVQNWMTAYNTLVDQLHSDTTYTPGTNGGSAQTGPLFSDPGTQQLMSQLPSSAESIMSSGTYKDLAAVGIVLNPNNGHIEFQSSAGFSGTDAIQNGQTLFTSALTSNSSDLQSLFGVVKNSPSTSEIPTSGVLGNVWTMVEGFGSIPGTGTIGGEITSSQKQIKSLNSYVQMVNQQIQQQVSDFTSQLSKLNASLAQTQAQMATIQALIGGSSSATSTSSSSSSTHP